MFSAGAQPACGAEQLAWKSQQLTNIYEQLHTFAISCISEHPSVAACDSAEQSAIEARRRTRTAEFDDFPKTNQAPIAKVRSSNRESPTPSGFDSLNL